MKIIVTATSPNLDSEVDPRFGRGAYFIRIDVETLEWEAMANPAVNASGGAGTQAAQFVAAQKAQVVISGDFGPNAYEALQVAGIEMVLFGPVRTVREAVEQFKAGTLVSVGAPTGPGHHGRR